MPRNSKKLVKKFLAVLILAGPGTVLSPIVTAPASAAVASASAPAEGLIRQKSDYGFDETVNRTVAVHSAALMEALDHIYGACRIVSELKGAPGGTAAGSAAK